MMYDALIVGAGAVGTNTTLFLSKAGLNVELIDLSEDILQGAPKVSFINHGDGFEYFKRGHQATGKYCIDGSIAKALIYPIRTLSTDVCNPKRPLRFFVSKDSISKGVLTAEEFVSNAGVMQEHFAERFEAVKASLNLSEAEAEHILLRRPATFFRKVDLPEESEVCKVSVGCAASSFGINMPHYYALLKSALAAEGITPSFSEKIQSIEKIGSIYQVTTNKRTIKTRAIILATAHHNPYLATMVRGAITHPPLPGTFYLNCMTFLRLPATTDSERINYASRINFTLQQEHGAMYACIVPPTARESGVAAIYYPSPKGSQLDYHIFDPQNPAAPPSAWDEIAERRLDSCHENVQTTFKQACKTYPFLINYAEVTGALCRTVFNASTPDSDRGLDRRVREIPALVSNITEDGLISSWTSPKWTNAELVALMAADNICHQLGAKGFPHSERSGLGPKNLDVAAISRKLNFFDIKMKEQDALAYARTQELPDRIVDRSLAEFL